MTEYCVKIMMYKGAHADTVVYYRNKLPMILIEKYRWYFEYLAALIKVHNPRIKVELIACPQELLQGRQYVERKTETLLIAKRSALRKCENEVISDDLFSYKSAENNYKKRRLIDEIKDLENGDFNYYVPVEYINRIKEFIKHS